MPLLPCFPDAKQTALNLSTRKSVTDQEKKNLSPGQKLWLRLHERLGHLGCRHIQWLCHSGLFDKISGIIISNCKEPIPPCVACYLGGLNKRPTSGKKRVVDPYKKGILSKENLHP